MPSSRRVRAPVPGGISFSDYGMFNLAISVPIPIRQSEPSPTRRGKLGPRTGADLEPSIAEHADGVSCLRREDSPPAIEIPAPCSYIGETVNERRVSWTIAREPATISLPSPALRPPQVSSPRLPVSSLLRSPRPVSLICVLFGQPRGFDRISRWPVQRSSGFPRVLGLVGAAAGFIPGFSWCVESRLGRPASV